MKANKTVSNSSSSLVFGKWIMNYFLASKGLYMSLIWEVNYQLWKGLHKCHHIQPEVIPGHIYWIYIKILRHCISENTFSWYTTVSIKKSPSLPIWIIRTLMNYQLKGGASYATFIYRTCPILKSKLFGN